MLTIKNAACSKAFRIAFSLAVFAVSSALTIILPVYSHKFDQTAMTELTLLSAFGAVTAFSELLCVITGFGRVKFAVLSAAADIVMLAVRTFMDWFTNLGLTAENGRYIFTVCLKRNIVLYFLVLAAVIAFGFIVHRQRKAGSAV